MGILHDRAQPDSGARFQRVLQLGIDEIAGSGRLDRPIEWVQAIGPGLPQGSARAVENAFAELDEQGVLAIAGPAISDNGLIARELADRARIPCINYTGGEQTRSEWMFHYQVGSLEDEPGVLAAHLVSRGLSSAAVIQDRSPIGERYADFFEQACGMLSIELVGRSVVSPVAEDLAASVERLRAAEPEALVYLGLGLSAFPVGRALADSGWRVPVVANSALMFGYIQTDWARLWEGWVYADAVAEGNARLTALRAQLGGSAGPGDAAACDIGRLLAEGLARAPHLTREGMRDGLERTKQLPASIGRQGTTMGFGQWERSALKGEFLVLRSWRDGQSVELGA